MSRSSGYGVVDLLAAVLRGTPKLEGALCIGRHTLFADLDGVDLDQRERVAAEAAALCLRCPALSACAKWAAAQGPHRLSGVVAGQVNGDNAQLGRSA